MAEERGLLNQPHVLGNRQQDVISSLGGPEREPYRTTRNMSTATRPNPWFHPIPAIEVFPTIRHDDGCIASSDEAPLIADRTSNHLVRYCTRTYRVLRNASSRLVSKYTSSSAHRSDVTRDGSVRDGMTVFSHRIHSTAPTRRLGSGNTPTTDHVFRLMIITSPNKRRAAICKRSDIFKRTFDPRRLSSFRVSPSNICAPFEPRGRLRANEPISSTVTSPSTTASVARRLTYGDELIDRSGASYVRSQQLSSRHRSRNPEVSMLNTSAI